MSISPWELDHKLDEVGLTFSTEELIPGSLGDLIPLELRNLSGFVCLNVDSALSRQESRGLYFSHECRDALPSALPSMLSSSLRKPF